MLKMRSLAPSETGCVPAEDREQFIRDNAVAVVADLEAKIRRQAEELKRLNHALHDKNIALRHLRESGHATTQEGPPVQEQEAAEVEQSKATPLAEGKVPQARLTWEE